MDDEAPYTKFIRPICLSPAELTASEGYVSGWGESEDTSKDHENIPKQIKVPILPNESCFLESPEFAKLASKRTICGGARNGTGPCRGDSGGGLFVKQGSAFYLKGLVSASLLNMGRCDVTNFALYSNVDKFSVWIENPSEDPTVNKVEDRTSPPPRVVDTKPTFGPIVYPTHPSYFPQNLPNYAQSYPTIPKPAITCGVMSSSKSLIQGGSQISREQCPWTVAILVKQSRGNFVYFSTGTLISDKHIITTGLSVATLDPVSQLYVARNPEDFQMIFGISDLGQTSLPGSSVVYGAARIVLHPHIKHGFPRIANVGILVMKQSVQMNKFVSPACLPADTIDFEEVDGRNAFAVGWGQDDTGSDSKVKKYASMKVRSQDDCEFFWSEYLQRGGSSKFFCAGGDGHKSACYRDQPLYLKNDGKWFVRGLISIAMNLPDNKCDLNKPVLYEDVGQYFNWIKSLL